MYSAYKFSELCNVRVVQFHFSDYHCLMSEEIKTVELNEKISTNSFFLSPGEGTSFELKSFHMAEHLTSNLLGCP